MIPTIPGARRNIPQTPPSWIGLDVIIRVHPCQLIGRLKVVTFDPHVTADANVLDSDQVGNVVEVIDHIVDGGRFDFWALLQKRQTGICLGLGIANSDAAHLRCCRCVRA
jgi:hypothetical protein